MLFAIMLHAIQVKTKVFARNQDVSRPKFDALHAVEEIKYERFIECMTIWNFSNLPSLHYRSTRTFQLANVSKCSPMLADVVDYSFQ